MAIYLGSSKKLKVTINKKPYRFQIIDSDSQIYLFSSNDYVLQDVNGLYLTAARSSTPDVPQIPDRTLLSSDNYILKDINGLYLIAALSSSTPETSDRVLLSSDSYILKDINGLYLISKEE